MNPIILKPVINDGPDAKMTFTLGQTNVSIANSIRRVILNDIPTIVFDTQTYNDQNCIISDNTTRFHNEIVKHRLSCIPIHSKDIKSLEKYVLEIDEDNNTDTMRYITTEHFKIKHKETGDYLTEEDRLKMFPPHPLTQFYIDFIRIRPKIGDSIPGEKLKLTCEFSVKCAKDNSTFNVVSKCAYGNTVDPVKISSAWDKLEEKFRSEGLNATEITYQKRNYEALDQQRQFVPDSFDFVIQSLGVYTNIEIVRKACQILHTKFDEIRQQIEDNTISINLGDTSIENCYDVTLEHEDYTVGKVLEYILYEKYYQDEKIFSFCGFKKLHPHDDFSRLRIAYEAKTDKDMLKQHLRIVCIEARDVYLKIYRLFTKPEAELGKTREEA